MRDRPWFVRLYGEITRAFASIDVQAVNHVLSCNVCTTISRLDHARYEVPYAQESGTCIWGPCYNSTICATGISVKCGTGKNMNPRFWFKIKASYIVSTERDVRRINGWIPYWPWSNLTNTEARFHVTATTQINKSVVYFIVRRNVKFGCSEC